MTTPDSELRRLFRMPLQAFGQETASDPPVEAFVPGNVALTARRLAASRLRIALCPTHEVADVLQAALDVVPEEDRRSWPEPPDWHGREFRRLLRTWAPRSQVDLAVHPANLTFLPPDQEILVPGWAPARDRDHAMSLAMLAAPLSHDTASQVMAAIVTILALAELRGAARCLHQKRLSRNALTTSASPAGPQPAAPPGRLPFQRPNLRPALQRALPTRRNLRLCP
jgi:hypothetical protein